MLHMYLQDGLITMNKSTQVYMLHTDIVRAIFAENATIGADELTLKHIIAIKITLEHGLKFLARRAKEIYDVFPRRLRV